MMQKLSQSFGGSIPASPSHVRRGSPAMTGLIGFTTLVLALMSAAQVQSRPMPMPLSLRVDPSVPKSPRRVTHVRSLFEDIRRGARILKRYVGVDKPTMQYAGGNLLVSPISLYIVWYGPTWTQRQKDIVLKFLPNFSAATPNAGNMTTVQQWWNINRIYTDKQKNPVSQSLTLRGQATDFGSAGYYKLSDNDIYGIAVNAINKGRLPLDSNGVYIVLTDPSTSVEGFCSNFCGYHSSVVITDQNAKRFNIPYAYIGNPLNCQLGVRTCSSYNYGGQSPNGDPGVDSMLSIIAHELAEVVTDPFEDGWYFANARGYVEENADHCAYTYGEVFQCGTNCRYNLVGANNAKYLIQQNYDLIGKRCAKGRAM